MFSTRFRRHERRCSFPCLLVVKSPSLTAVIGGNYEWGSGACNCSISSSMAWEISGSSNRKGLGLPAGVQNGRVIAISKELANHLETRCRSGCGPEAWLHPGHARRSSVVKAREAEAGRRKNAWPLWRQSCAASAALREMPFPERANRIRIDRQCSRHGPNDPVARRHGSAEARSNGPSRPRSVHVPADRWPHPKVVRRVTPPCAGEERAAPRHRRKQRNRQTTRQSTAESRDQPILRAGNLQSRHQDRSIHCRRGSRAAVQVPLGPWFSIASAAGHPAQTSGLRRSWPATPPSCRCRGHTPHYGKNPHHR